MARRVKDTTAPTVAITAPANGDTVSGLTTISATASDAGVGGVVKVEFFINGALIATDLTAPYSTTWTPPAAGNYTIGAKAWDKAGNSSLVQIAVSKTVIIVVDPPPDDPLPLARVLPAPPIWAQGGEGSCMANSNIAVFSIEKYMAANATAFDPMVNIFSVEYFYDKFKLGADCGSGMASLSCLSHLINDGVCKWATLPYSANNGCDPAVLVTGDMDTEAANYKISSYVQMLKTDRPAIKKRLAGGHPCLCTFSFDANYYYATDGYIWSSRPADGVLWAPHANAIIGYDDTKGPNGCYLFRNSWGTVWGTQGNIWVDYLFFEQISSYVYSMIL